MKNTWLLLALPVVVARFWVCFAVLLMLVWMPLPLWIAARMWRRLRSTLYACGRHCRPSLELEFVAVSCFVKARPWRRTLQMALFWLIAPAVSLLEAAGAARRYGEKAKRMFAASGLRQFAELWRLQLDWPLAFYRQSFRYYSLVLRCTAGMKEAPLVFAPLPQNMLMSRVNAPDFGQPTGFMDKRDFARTCQAKGLPHIPIIADFENGAAHWWQDTRTLPSGDLFVKPAQDANGSGAFRVWHCGDGRYRGDSGASWTADSLVADLLSQSRQQVLLLQPRLVNHSLIQKFAGATLSTTRIATGFAADGSHEIYLAIQRIGVGTSPVDNSAKCGIACPVDLDSGELGTAVSVSEGSIDMLCIHPDTGEKFAGVRLPHWQQTIALVNAAMDTWRETPFIGWDVAICETGPILVEANVIWVADALQSANCKALGRLNYASSLRHHLQQRTQKRRKI